MNKQLLTLALSISLMAMPVLANAQNTNSGNGDQNVSATNSTSSTTFSLDVDALSAGSDNDGNTNSAINSGNLVDSFNTDAEVNNSFDLSVSESDNSGVNQGLDNGSSITNQTNDLSTGDRLSATFNTTNSGNFDYTETNTATANITGNGNQSYDFSWADSSQSTSNFAANYAETNTYSNNIIGDGNASFDTVGVGINGIGSVGLLGDSGLNINNNQTYVITGDNANLNNINQPVGD